MNIEADIRSLRELVERETAEAVLAASIDECLGQLRELYRRNRKAFTNDDVRFLQWVGNVSVTLQEFINEMGELSDIYDFEQFSACQSRLLAIRDRLTGLPVEKRVAKELRELNERMPTLAKCVALEADSDERRRRHILQSNTPNCPRGYPMVLRLGDGGYFWGCSRFPWCEYTTRLTEGQKQKL